MSSTIRKSELGRNSAIEGELTKKEYTHPELIKKEIQKELIQEIIEWAEENWTQENNWREIIIRKKDLIQYLKSK